MKALFGVLILVLSLGTQAKASLLEHPEEAQDWKSFDLAMAHIQEQDRIIGTSYLASGVLVTLGSAVGYYSTTDTTSKVVLALSQSVGIAAIGYGAAKLNVGHAYGSFYEAVKSTKLTNEQKNQLLKVYLAQEKEKRDSIRNIKIATHLLVGAVNLYSSSQEKDKNVKTVFQFLAAVNFAVAFAYTF